jgi:hypothetical protein
MGVLSSKGEVGRAKNGLVTMPSGSGSGGSLRVDGYDVTLSTQSINGGAAYSSYGYGGGAGRIAVYYYGSNNVISNSTTYVEMVIP